MRFTLIVSSFVLIAASFTNAGLIERQQSGTVVCKSARADNKPMVGWSNITTAAYPTRPSHIYIPNAYTGGKLPIVMTLHNSRSNGMNFAKGMNFTGMAEKYNFLIIAPTGGVKYLSPENQYTWNVSFVPPQDSEKQPAVLDYAKSLKEADRPYLQSLLTEVQSWDCVEPRNTSVLGFSGGGRQASSLACSNSISKQIGAIAAFSSLRAGPSDPAVTPEFSAILSKDTTSNGEFIEACNPSHGLGILSVHGTADNINNYTGNALKQWGYNMVKTKAKWASLFNCAAQANVTLTNSPNIIKETWKCPPPTAGAPVDAGINFYIVDGFTHDIPKDNATSKVGANFHYQQRTWEFVSVLRLGFAICLLLWHCTDALPPPRSSQFQNYRAAL